MKHPFVVAVLTAAFLLLPAQAQVRIVASPAATPPAGTPTVLDSGKFVWLDLAGSTGPISWDFSTPGVVALPPDGSGEFFGGVKQGATLPDWHKSPSKTSVPCLGVKTGTTTVSAWGVVDGRAKKLADLTIQVGARPPPDIEPAPVDPIVPKPVTSFRVFLVVESGQNVTPAQSAVLFGNVVEEYLNANCTGGKSGWRRRDRSLGGESDPKMADLWAAIQPKLTTMPACAVEVNNRVEIIPLEATPAKMVETLNKYRGK